MKKVKAFRERIEKKDRTEYTKSVIFFFKKMNSIWQFCLNIFILEYFVMLKKIC